MTKRRKHGGGKRRSAVGSTEPTRMCIACRSTEPAEGLLRFVRAPDGEVALDVAQKLPGRGAWTCPDVEHIQRAVERNAFARAFDAPVIVPVGLVERIVMVLEREALYGLGLLRRQGKLFPGRTEALSAVAAGEARVVVTARDLALRSVRDVAEAVKGRVDVVVGPDKASMGDALGRGPTGVLAIGTGPLASRVVSNIERLARLWGLVPVGEASGAPCETGVAGV